MGSPLIKLIESRPRARGSKRSVKDLKRLCEAARLAWRGMEELRWVEWLESGEVLMVRRLA